MEKLYEIKLSYNELIMLDNNVNEEAQVIINSSKQENDIGFDFPIMNEIILKSLNSGELNWRKKRITSCNHCDKTYDYYRYSRNGKHHNKGDKDYKKRIYYDGIKFNEGSVTIVGLGDMCIECEKKYQVIDKLIEYILDRKLPIELQDKDRTLYVKDKIKICFECEEEIQESQMGILPSMFGGSYSGECPKCGAKSLPFGRSHKYTSKFIMLKQTS